jgi:hypothetical protein
LKIDFNIDSYAKTIKEKGKAVPETGLGGP